LEEVNISFYQQSYNGRFVAGLKPALTTDLNRLSVWFDLFQKEYNSKGIFIKFTHLCISHGCSYILRIVEFAELEDKP
jgi:hypothetical protein